MTNLPSNHIDTLIVTVNYKTSHLVKELINSLLDEVKSLGNTNMVIVDNASGDGSIDYIQNYIDENSINWITVIESQDNAGFAAGNNLAINTVLNKKINFKQVWFLNPDTRVRAKAGTELLKAIQENDFHIVGSGLEDDDGTAQCSHFNFPGFITQLSDGLRLGIFDKLFKNHLITKPVTTSITKADWLSGASFMITKHYIDTVGLLDNKYFLYFEELDYCLQGARNNMPCWHIPSSRVYHAVGAATGISDHRKKAPRRPQYWFNSRRRFFIKNYGATKLILCDLAFILGYSTWLFRTKLSGDKSLAIEPPHFMKDFIKNSFLYRGLSLKDK